MQHADTNNRFVPKLGLFGGGRGKKGSSYLHMAEDDDDNNNRHGLATGKGSVLPRRQRRQRRASMSSAPLASDEHSEEDLAYFQSKQVFPSKPAKESEFSVREEVGWAKESCRSNGTYKGSSLAHHKTSYCDSFDLDRPNIHANAPSTTTRTATIIVGGGEQGQLRRSSLNHVPATGRYEPTQSETVRPHFSHSFDEDAFAPPIPASPRKKPVNVDSFDYFGAAPTTPKARPNSYGRTSQGGGTGGGGRRRSRRSSFSHAPSNGVPLTASPRRSSPRRLSSSATMKAKYASGGYPPHPYSDEDHHTETTARTSEYGSSVENSPSYRPRYQTHQNNSSTRQKGVGRSQSPPITARRRMSAW